MRQFSDADTQKHIIGALFPRGFLPFGAHGDRELLRIGQKERIIDSEPDRYRTEKQREWANWAAHGYRKLYQPRSVLRFGLVFSLVLAAVLFTVFWFAAH